jgi:hypothetical protein
MNLTLKAVEPSLMRKFYAASDASGQTFREWVLDALLEKMARDGGTETERLRVKAKDLSSQFGSMAAAAQMQTGYAEENTRAENAILHDSKVCREYACQTCRDLGVSDPIRGV